MVLTQLLTKFERAMSVNRALEAQDWRKAQFKVWELATFLFDKYLDKAQVSPSRVWLVALVCLLVAIKVG